MISSSLETIRRLKLDMPFPMKYSPDTKKEYNMIPQEIFAMGYERNSIWAHIGMIFCDVMYRYDKDICASYLQQYRKQILRHKNFLEVYSPRGRMFRTPFYLTDESMSWAAIYLDLSEKLGLER